MRLLELFSGTGSVGRAFSEKGWDVVSLDLDPKASCSIRCDVLDWDYTLFPTGFFDCVWASPPCTEYSIARTTAKTPRNLVLADSLAQCTLDIIRYFAPKTWWIENPYTGLLRTRPLVQGLPYKIVDYCRYGAPYRKRTLLLTNATSDFLCCNGRCGSIVDGRHVKTAQRGPGLIAGARRVGDGCTLSLLHALPPELCAEIVHATVVNQVGSDEEPPPGR